jgi:capsular exopolysaccharide synthesis family protein
MGRLERALERMKNSETADAPIHRAAAPRRAPGRSGLLGKDLPVTQLDKKVLVDHRVINESTDSGVRTAYKMLRTRVLQRMRANGWQSLAVTSAMPSDGKTLTAINLAISLAGDVNHNVCLVDLDLRHSSVARCLGIEAEVGVSDCLRREATLEQVLMKPDIERLLVLPNLHTESNSSELISSPEMNEIAQKLVLDDPQRMVIYDMPPVLSADDMLAFARFVDAVLFVVSEGSTRQTDVLKARELLETVNVIGTVLNQSNFKTSTYY